MCVDRDPRLSARPSKRCERSRVVPALNVRRPASSCEGPIQRPAEPNGKDLAVCDNGRRIPLFGLPLCDGEIELLVRCQTGPGGLCGSVVEGLVADDVEEA